MLRKLVLAVPVTAALLLSGCATTGTSTVITQIQSTAVAICGFLPTVTTVANILANGNPIVTSITDVASVICAAVTPKAARRGAVIPTVNGVTVRGRFVR